MLKAVQNKVVHIKKQSNFGIEILHFILYITYKFWALCAMNKLG